MKNNKEILTALIQFTRPIDLLVSDLASVEHDIEPVVTIFYKDVIAVLERYINGDITDKDLRTWAELLEMRDGIDFEIEASKTDIPGIIFELANPEINYPINIESIKKLYNLIK